MCTKFGYDQIYIYSTQLSYIDQWLEQVTNLIEPKKIKPSESFTINNLTDDERQHLSLLLCEAYEKAGLIRNSFYYYNDPLNDMILDLALILHCDDQTKKLTPEARSYLQYGVQNRLCKIFASYKIISEIAYHNRVKSLQEDERNLMNTHLNIFYINIRAILDNYACAYFYQKEPGLTELKDDKGNKIDTGYKLIIWQHSKSAIWDQLKDHQPWVEYMSKIRNQVAHGMPLYVPQLLNAQEAMEYLNLVFKSDPDSSLEAQATAHNLGSFQPVFCYLTKDNRAAPYNIDDRISEALGHLISIHQTIISAIKTATLEP